MITFEPNFASMQKIGLNISIYYFKAPFTEVNWLCYITSIY